MKRIVCIFLVLLLCVGLLPVSALAAATFITRVELSLNLPVAGQTIPNNCSLHGNGYTIHAIDWEEIGERGFLEAGSTFREGCTYEATVWVKAADGYEFSYADSRTPAITGYINGQEVEVSKAYEYNAWAMVCLSVTFYSIPSKGWIKDVNLSVPVPQAGELPSYKQLQSTGYKTANVSFSGSDPVNMENGIAWYSPEGDRLKPGQDTFAENTVYTFHCLVFPEDGYKITENATVYVNGKEAEAKLDYDRFLSVEYTFPATGRIPPVHTHTPSDWRVTGAYHYTACTTCGEFLEQEDHKWSPTYLYQDKTGHAWICADCKTTSQIIPHTAGPAGTPGAAVVCRDCGYIMEPAKDHKHDLTKVPATPAECLLGGNIEYYFCTGCNDCFRDAEGNDKIPETESVLTAPLGHTLSDAWGMDEGYHWRSCTVCKQVLGETMLAHEYENGKCTTCGYGEGTAIVPTDPTETAGQEATTPTQPQAQPSNTENGLDWLTVALIGVVCFAAAITATVIILKKKK